MSKSSWFISVALPRDMVVGGVRNDVLALFCKLSLTNMNDGCNHYKRRWWIFWRGGE